MRAEYKRDMNHNYLILHGETEVDTASYQVRMLIGNGISSLLKCRMQGVDGNTLFYYEITSKQSVQTLFEQKKLCFRDLQIIFGGFVQVVEEMGEYLLNPENLLIQPEYLYLDVEKGEVYFCYLPGWNREVREQFRCFTEYMLPKLDHTDAKAVMLGYGIYRSALEDQFHLEHMKEELYQMRLEHPDFGCESGDEGQKEKERIQRKEDNRILQEISEQDLWKTDTDVSEKGLEKSQDFSRKNQNFQKQKFLYKILFCFLGAGTILAILVSNVLGYFPWISVEWLLGGILILMGIGMLFYVLYFKKRKKKEENDKLETYMQSWEEQGSSRKKDLQQEDPWERESSVQGCREEEAILEEKEEGKHRKEEIDYGETVVLSEVRDTGPASLVSREPGELATIYLKEDITVIGKLETASDAVIPLPTVSRIHAKIRKRDGEYYLTDLNSRNGTSVNGKMLREEEYLLKNEDEIDFAQARYIFIK